MKKIQITTVLATKIITTQKENRRDRTASIFLLIDDTD